MKERTPKVVKKQELLERLDAQDVFLTPEWNL